MRAAILKCLQWLLQALNIVACVPAMPLGLLVLGTRRLVVDGGLDPQPQAGGVRTYLLVGFLPRLVVTLLALGVLATQLGGVNWLLATYAWNLDGRPWLHAIMAGVHLLLLAWGLIFLPRQSTLFADLGLARYLTGMAWAVLDGCTFGVAVCVMALLVRAPHLWAIDAQEGDGVRHAWRRFVLWQLAMTVVDWLLVPFAVCLVLLPWRLKTVVASWQQLAGRQGDQRLMLLEQVCPHG